MKFRRRFATGTPLWRLLDRLRARLFPPTADITEPDGGVTHEPYAPPEPPAAVRDKDAEIGGEEPVEAAGAVLRLQRWVARWAAKWPFDPRRSLTVAGLLVGAFALGYAFAATVVFPAPIIAASRSVPRVLGQPEVRARETLRAAGFGVGSVERSPHATVPAGNVFWQDPPPDVVAPETTEVALVLSSGPQRVPVPDVAGYDADDARMLIEHAGLRVGSTESTQAPTPRNVAVNTRPPAGTTLSPGTEVTLVVSVGAATIRVPTLLGLTLDEARLALETAGLSLGTAFAQTTNSAAPGEVFYQEPNAGTLSAPGTAVNVRIARSP